LKNQHAIIHGVIIILISLAGSASYASHIYNDPPIQNFYSLHSWLGIVTTLMFFSQVLKYYLFNQDFTINIKLYILRFYTY